MTDGLGSLGGPLSIGSAVAISCDFLLSKLLNLHGLIIAFYALSGKRASHDSRHSYRQTYKRLDD